MIRSALKFGCPQKVLNLRKKHELMKEHRSLYLWLAVVLLAVAFPVGVHFASKTTRDNNLSEGRTFPPRPPHGGVRETAGAKAAEQTTAAKPIPGQRTDRSAMLKGASNDGLSEARAAMSRSAYDKAVPLLLDALAATSDSAQRRRISTMLVECLVRTQDFAGAETVCKELLASVTSDEERAADSLRLTQLYTLQKNYAAAEQTLEQVSFISENPELERQVQSAKLRLWQSQPGRLASAVTNLEVQVTADPGDRASLELLGTIYLKVQRDYAKAKPLYEQMVAADPANPSLQNTLINICRHG